MPLDTGFEWPVFRHRNFTNSVPRKPRTKEAVRDLPTRTMHKTKSTLKGRWTLSHFITVKQLFRSPYSDHPFNDSG